MIVSNSTPLIYLAKIKRLPEEIYTAAIEEARKISKK